VSYFINYFHKRVKDEIEALILHAFVKKTPDTPEKELKIAKKRMKEVQNG